MRRFKRSSLSAAIVISLVTSLFATSAPTSSADAVPRKILTGWIPYYSMKTALPDALNNADLIKEVMPFGTP